MATPAVSPEALPAHDQPEPFDRAVLALRAAAAGSPHDLAAAALRVFLTPRRKTANPAQLQLLAGARRVVYHVDGLPVHGHVWTPTDAAHLPPVLLVHGWESHAGQLAALAVGLRARGHHVIAIDGPAHGVTGGEQTDLMQFGRVVRRVVEAHGGVHAVVGHSFGAAASALALVRDPWLRERVGRLALLGAPSALHDVMRGYLRQARLPEALLPLMAGLLEARYGYPIDTYDFGVVGGQLNVPTLIVHDREDQVIPFDSAVRNAAALPEAQLFTTSGLGHNRILNDAAVLERLVAFLDVPAR